MFVAYFIKKTKQKVLKIVKKDDLGNFERKGINYNINPDAVMWKKAFGIKLFRYSDYFEGNPNPIVYDFASENIIVDNIYVNSVAIMMKKILKWWVEYAMLGISILTFFMVMILWYQIYGGG